MRIHHILLIGAILVVSRSAAAFERDVHFGLTEWLALQAGFTAQQAEAIATGDQRIDSGDMPFIELEPIYACFAKDTESATDVARHHFPSQAAPPRPPEQRPVVPAVDPAQRTALFDMTKILPAQSGFMLFKLGEGLHAVQDSWSHQGVPEVPKVLDGIVGCDPALAFGHPRARGGWNSHKADLTHEWPADTLAMASATYDVLRQYPPIGDVQRSAKDWAQLRSLLDGFIRASTKSQKKKWFVEHGIADISFLEGITLADGTETLDLHWNLHKLPPLSKLESTQHHIDAPLLEFFSGLFSQWMSSDDFDALASAFGSAAPPRASAPHDPMAAMGSAELAARFRAWRIRDHGRVAEMAHSLQPLTAQQRNTLSSIAKARDGLIAYVSPRDAFYPLTVKGPEPSPLVGFLISAIPPSAGGGERAVATAKLRHAPYDTIVVLAERLDGRWRVMSVGALVEH